MPLNTELMGQGLKRMTYNTVVGNEYTGTAGIAWDICRYISESVSALFHEDRASNLAATTVAAGVDVTRTLANSVMEFAGGAADIIDGATDIPVIRQVKKAVGWVLRNTLKRGAEFAGKKLQAAATRTEFGNRVAAAMK